MSILRRTSSQRQGYRPQAVPLEQLREEVGSVGAIPHQLTIDLGTTITDKEFNIAGDVLVVWFAPTITDQIQIRINDQSNPAIPFVIGHKIVTPFHKVFITCPGTSAGTMYLLYGMGGSQGLLDMEVTAQDVPGAMASMLTALQAIQEELQGETTEDSFGEVAVGAAAVQIRPANTNRHGMIISPDPANANMVYLGCDNTVAANKYFRVFNAGAADECTIHDYRGAIYAIAGGGGNNVGYVEW